jgi:hypothetical protein
MDTQRYEAIGQRGEACIIVERTMTADDAPATRTYCLATGERLRPAETPGTYVTLDGNRTFRLRHGEQPLRILPKPSSPVLGSAWAKRKAA